MPAPKMLAGLPKPVLFGLYGAVGGLIGALVFGELIWFILRPAQAKQDTDPRVAITASKDLTIFQSGTNKLFVQIARDRFDESVAVRVEGLPAGVTATELTIPGKETEGEITLLASQTATVSTVKVKVVATAKSGGKEVTATTEVQLTTATAGVAQADIVFVLDVTGSMQAQIDGLQRGIGTFARDLASAKVDARFGCVIFRDLAFKEPGGFPQEQLEVLKFKGEVFTSDPRSFSAEVAKHRASGGDDLPESSFEALSAAAQVDGWRKTAVRTLVLITDAPPKCDEIVGRGGQRRPTHPPGQSVKATVDSLRDNKIDLLHLVIGDPDPEHLRADPGINRRMQNFYREVQQGAIGVPAKDGSVDKGREFDLPQVARNANEMTQTLLPQMTQAIVTAAESKRPDGKAELPARPEAASIKGVQSSDNYDASAKGQLVLAVGVWTGAIASLVCLFLLGGQHHYLRGSLPAAGGILAGLGGGLLVGIIGGAAGQGLFLLAPDSTILQIIFRVMGWTILGSMAGAGLSLFVPNLKLVYGLAGGAIGGAVGAIGYIATDAIAGKVLGPAVGGIMGRLAGGFVLGLFIGLMVAVVEAAFRRAWLEVQYGPRETVTVNLGAEPVKVGSDSRACTVWARGAADVALRYFIRDGQVICTDVPSRTEEVVRDGDTREAGKVTIVVRTGSGKASSEPKRKKRSEPSLPPKKPRREPEREPEPEPKPKPLSLDDDYDDGLPMPVSPSAPPLPAPAPAPVPPPAPARTTAPSAPPRPPAPPPAPPRPATPPTAAPTIKSTARDPDACPSCGRKNAGRPGTRYCMVCDQTY